VSAQIVNCSLWHRQGVQGINAMFKKYQKAKGRNAEAAVGFLNRLFLLSIWHNKNKYLLCNKVAR
jgi:hypothetical protein